MKIFNTSLCTIFRGGLCILNLFLGLAVTANAEQKEIEVSSFYAKVYVAPSTNANFIGLIQKGERYPVLGIKDNWYNIRFKNVNGWIEFSQARVIDKNAVVEAPPAPTSGGTASSSMVRSGSDTPKITAANKTIDTVVRTPSPEVATIGTVETTASKPINTVTPPRPMQQQVRPITYQPRPTPPPPVRKPESRIRSWFSQQTTPELPPTINPNDDQDEPISYFRVILPAAVYEFADSTAPVLGMTVKGEVLRLISEGDCWCKVRFADTIGWMEKKMGKIVDETVPPPLDYVKIAFTIGALILLLIVVIKLLRLQRPAKLALDTSVVKKNVVIISKNSTSIQYTLTNGTIPLERTFTEVGFEVFFVKSGAVLKTCLLQNKPDILMIDYQFDSKIIPVVERLCIAQGIAGSVMAIVYNVPNPSSMHPGKSLPNMLFLGTSFSDRDIFKLITPMLRSEYSEKIQKSVQSSALAGNIQAGNLLEVLQFIEIGSKTGCLLIEVDKPFAIICFKNGRINFAATANKITGRDAIFKVLELKKGKFRFVLDKKPKESNVNLSTLEVLMEWTKTVDEAHEH